LSHVWMKLNINSLIFFVEKKEKKNKRKIGTNSNIISLQNRLRVTKGYKLQIVVINDFGFVHGLPLLLDLCLVRVS